MECPDCLGSGKCHEAVSSSAVTYMSGVCPTCKGKGLVQWEDYERLLSAMEEKKRMFDILVTRSLELQNMCDAKDKEIYLLRTEVEWLRESHNEELRERELEDEIR